MPRPDLVRAFTDGASFPVAGGGTCAVRVEPAGELRLATGALIAADPSLLFGDAAPFARRLPSGSFPVLLSVATTSFHGRDGTPHTDERIGAAMLRFGDGKPERWELAVLDGEDPASLVDDEVFGYPVTSGFGCFIDAGALDAYTDLGDEPIDEFELLLEAFPTDAKRRRCAWADFPLEDGDRHNLIAFSAGWYADAVGAAEADGAESGIDGELDDAAVCPTWFGLASDGTPLCAVTDFGVLPLG
jgi:hypothetical protein